MSNEFSLALKLAEYGPEFLEHVKGIMETIKASEEAAEAATETIEEAKEASEAMPPVPVDEPAPLDLAAPKSGMTTAQKLAIAGLGLTAVGTAATGYEEYKDEQAREAQTEATEKNTEVEESNIAALKAIGAKLSSLGVPVMPSAPAPPVVPNNLGLISDNPYAKSSVPVPPMINQQTPQLNGYTGASIT